jgi:ubiquitin-activating enzyme E1
MAGGASFDKCVRVFFDKFVEYFHHNIKDLIHAFPEDARTIDKETKADLGAFWHGAKRFPCDNKFKASNDDHLEFIYHGACVLASVFNITPSSKEEVRALCAGFAVPEWQPTNKNISLEEDDKKAKAEVNAGQEEDVEGLKASLNAMDLSKVAKLTPADFEKDDDTNHHIDVIRAATNLRAFNYHIKATTNQHVRMIAGRIIPAIATTTACITGFIQLEILKHVMGCPLDSFRAATINLAMNVFCVENLPDPIKAKNGLDPETYMETVWH